MKTKREYKFTFIKENALGIINSSYIEKVEEKISNNDYLVICEYYYNDTLLGTEEYVKTINDDIYPGSIIDAGLCVDQERFYNFLNNVDDEVLDRIMDDNGITFDQLETYAKCDYIIGEASSLSLALSNELSVIDNSISIIEKTIENIKANRYLWTQKYEETLIALRRVNDNHDLATSNLPGDKRRIDLINEIGRLPILKHLKKDGLLVDADFRFDTASTGTKIYYKDIMLTETNKLCNDDLETILCAIEINLFEHFLYILGIDNKKLLNYKYKTKEYNDIDKTIDIYTSRSKQCLKQCLTSQSIMDYSNRKLSRLKERKQDILLKMNDVQDAVDDLIDEACGNNKRFN